MSLRIAIFDDNKNIRQSITLLISTNPDMEVVGSFGNVLNCVNDCLKCEPDIVLMDIQMPVLSGFDATRKIRKNNTIRQPKIIAVTAAVLREELDEATAVGMDDHVCKPLASRAIQDVFVKLFGARYATTITVQL